MNETSGEAFSFHCNACGKCCNTPPAMTLAELFHHQHRFIGGLAIRRLPGAPGAAAPHFDVSTRGLDYPSRGACPARLADGRCAVHADGKPAMCATVPLDPFLPDDAQPVVLRRRSRNGDVIGSDYIGADCIVSGRREGFVPLVEAGRIVDPAYRQQLASQREALAADRAQWADAVMASLRQAAQAGDDTLRRLPAGAHLTLPLVPVLAVVAARSDAERERSLGYAEAQIALIDAAVRSALARRLAQDRPFTAELRSAALAYRRFIEALALRAPAQMRTAPAPT